MAPNPAGGPPERGSERNSERDLERDPGRYRDRYGQLLGIEVVEVGEGHASVALTADERLARYRIAVVRLPERELVAVAQGQVAIVAGRSS